MASSKSARLSICHGEETAWPSCQSKPSLCNYCSYPKKSNVFFTHGLTVKGRSKSKGFVVNGGELHVGEIPYGVSEEYSQFVEVLREAQPYIFLHRGSKFVVLLSAEVVASPCLDTILKVDHLFL